MIERCLERKEVPFCKLNVISFTTIFIILSQPGSLNSGSLRSAELPFEGIERCLERKEILFCQTRYDQLHHDLNHLQSLMNVDSPEFWMRKIPFDQAIELCLERKEVLFVK